MDLPENHAPFSNHSYHLKGPAPFPRSTCGHFRASPELFPRFFSHRLFWALSHGLSGSFLFELHFFLLNVFSSQRGYHFPSRLEISIFTSLSHLPRDPLSSIRSVRTTHRPREADYSLGSYTTHRIFVFFCPIVFRYGLFFNPESVKPASAVDLPAKDILFGKPL